MSQDEVIELPEVETTNEKTDEKAQQIEDGPKSDEPRLKVSKRQFYLIYAAMMMGMFLVSLDQTIVSTALPDIVSEFKRLVCCDLPLDGIQLFLHPIFYVVVTNITEYFCANMTNRTYILGLWSHIC